MVLTKTKDFLSDSPACIKILTIKMLTTTMS